MTKVETRAKGFGRLDRRAAVRALLEGRKDLLTVTGLGSPTYDVFAAGDHDANMYLWGAMGGAAMIGLGLALAQKSRPIVVVTGDGEQLMGLGALATIAVKQPGNLSLIVLDNGHYGETGQQASHTGLGNDLHRIAAAAGFAAVELTDLAGVTAYRHELLRLDGPPRFATIRISPEAPVRALPARDGVHLKNRFRAHLGLSVN
jgi:thiamine pyrophosphate-dependent acetolactate synthase large subunit-like protein